ncbi:putative homeodomain transcription factor [Bombus vancouverensis nearcticus]|uniref:Homeodomain transcription factor isoform X1 n=1 Tax=Bombus bifarius TaxID=103933 RepID=A0A6P8MML1_9HYME|nr:putative homeodomain transcription factor isoform X1 [Bombus vancouverensis nearcticus]XP_033309573.1 putative homeodomain transcription factor isoform X1 [Bombus bifarius]
MKLNELVYWYQKKIGTYDKQQWEKTVEQHILEGFTHVPMRTAKLKTELIDVDLVRGSSFPKAKPKHGLSTVACLALQRLLLLPLYRKWWIQQTSLTIFTLFLLLYSLQLINMGIYFCQMAKDNESDIISTSEVLIPAIMMLTLCVVHSHIVSTHSGPTIGDGQNKQKIVRRLRHTRCRMGKSRTRQNLRLHKDSKSSQDTASEKASTVSDEVLTSVRFAKKVVIENSLTVSRSQEFLTAQASCDNEPMNVAVNHPLPINEASASHTQSNEVPDPNIKNIHQDDDGFESLNGNVSSDNDKSAARVPEKFKHKRELLKNNEERILWLEDSTSQQVLQSKFSAPELLKSQENSSNSEAETSNKMDKDQCLMGIGSREGRQQCESEEEGECEETVTNHLTEATTSATEWMGVTTNSDECSYSSELEESDLHNETNKNYGEFVEHPFSWEFELPPSIMLISNCASYDRVSCTIWTRRDIKKAELSVLDISSAIIARVESMPENMNYFYGGLMLSVVLALIPSIKRLSDHVGMDNSSNVTSSLIPNDLTYVNLETYSDILAKVIDLTFGTTLWERIVVLISAFERLILSSLLFFLLAVAERTYKQRLLYAKLFSHLTSSRRARKSDLPHFRLNKVRNIKLWLSVRSYLKRRGPQRSVDVIVSAVFIVTLLLLSFVSLELIKDLESLHSRYNVEALFWSFSLGIFILRFMTLGTKINKKYRNLSVLITEQINLYLQIEQKPHKKEELMVANNVLKLAADLIKELECPFKISGLSANPYLYTITKVVLLSALSGVLSELLGFKLKLHKIKIK